MFNRETEGAFPFILKYYNTTNYLPFDTLVKRLGILTTNSVKELYIGLPVQLLFQIVYI